MYPEYVEVEGTKYKINTDFRYALKCNEIAEDSSIGDMERALAIIYTLFNEEGLNAYNHHTRLVELALKYLACGKEIDRNITGKPDMSFNQDYDYIEASFMSDYNIDLSTTNMHWWKFYKLINGLSNSDIGNCCVLNRVRNIRNINLKDIKDPKERERLKKAKESVALKPIKRALSSEQKQSASSFYKELLRRE